MAVCQREDIVSLFDSLDKNSDDKVSMSELKEGIKNNFCPDITDDQVVAMFMGFDDDADKCISKEEFMEEMCDKVSRKVAFKQAFDGLDSDKNGSLSLEEVRPLLEQNGLDSDAIQSIFDQVDVNEDGKVSCEEFLKLL